MISGDRWIVILSLVVLVSAAGEFALGGDETDSAIGCVADCLEVTK